MAKKCFFWGHKNSIFQGARLLFKSNVPGGTIIPEGTFIPYFRVLRAFKRHIMEFPRSTGSEMAGRQSLECESSFRFSGIYVVK